MIPIILLLAGIVVYQSVAKGQKPSTGIMVAVLVIAAIFFAVLLWPSK
jgi:hypothetical protein